jgi:hypothetical protein
MSHPNHMRIPTLRALARLLHPWLTIRRLEYCNKAFSDALAKWLGSYADGGYTGSRSGGPDALLTPAPAPPAPQRPTNDADRSILNPET